jgi:hypothetical protein
VAAKRSKYLSPGWWKWQLKKPLAHATHMWQLAVSLYRKGFPKRLSDDEQWDAWREHIDRLHIYIAEIFRHRRLFNEISEMLRTHPTLATNTNAGYVLEWLRNLYGHYVTIAIRRELDRDANVVNLRRLLWEISQRPEVLSRERY